MIANARRYLLRWTLLIAVGALSLGATASPGPRLDAGLRPGDTGLGWMSDPDGCPAPPRDPKSPLVPSDSGKFAGGILEYCDDASAKNQAAEISLHYFSQDLAQRGDPRWLFLEPVFSKAVTATRQIDSQKTQWMERALRSAPQDALIAWAAAEDCMMQSCDRVAMARHVVELEPDNGAAHLLLAVTLSNHDDEATARAELAKAAATKRYRTPEQALLAKRLATLQGWNPPRPRASSGAEAATCLADWTDCAELHRYELAMSDDEDSVWSFVALDNMCKPHSVPTTDASLRADCERVYQAMAENDFSQHGQQDALQGLVALTSAKEDLARWNERLREYQWITSWGTAPDRSGPKARLATAQAYFDTWVRSGWIDAWRGRLVRAGVAAMPPPDWKSDGSTRMLPPTDSAKSETGGALAPSKH